MTHIWRSLIPDSKKSIDEHFDLIMDDLLTQSGSRLWRSREASCLALSDVIQGRKFDQVKSLICHLMFKEIAFVCDKHLEIFNRMIFSIMIEKVGLSFEVIG